MPHDLTKKIESLAMDLDIAQWHDEDGFAPELAPILMRVQE
jgi:hypothetical protein